MNAHDTNLDFAELEDCLQSIVDLSEPTPDECAMIWEEACRTYEAGIKLGSPPAAVRQAVSEWLISKAYFLGSRGGIYRNFYRKLEEFQAERKIRDGRTEANKAKRAPNFRSAEYRPDLTQLLRAWAKETGDLSSAWRLCLEKEEKVQRRHSGALFHPGQSARGDPA